MIQVRKADDRGRADHGWLFARHSFSFADYFNPEWVQFGSLRVLNHDQIQAGKGFGLHPHQNMEIITIVLKGVVSHRDSMGNEKTVSAGEIQVMSAGTGVVHSEHNRENSVLELFQIWILPDREGGEPSYQQQQLTSLESTSSEDSKGALNLIVSPDGENGSLSIHQKAKIFRSVMAPGQTLSYEPADQENQTWIQMVEGGLDLEGTPLSSFDGAGISGRTSPLTVRALEPTEFFLFDLS